MCFFLHEKLFSVVGSWCLRALNFITWVSARKLHYTVWVASEYTIQRGKLEILSSNIYIRAWVSRREGRGGEGGGGGGGGGWSRVWGETNRLVKLASPKPSSGIRLSVKHLEAHIQFLNKRN